MGIKFYCPNGHKLNVKSFLAGKRGICPHCGAKVDIPAEAGMETLQGVVHPGGAVYTPDPAAAQAGRAQVPTGPLAQPAPQARHVEAQPAPQAPYEVPNDGAYGIGPSPVNYGSSNGPPAGVPVASPVPPAGVAVHAAPRDPIAEAPHAVWYVRPPSGGQYGPATGDIMRRWITEGRVSADSQVWREGWADWEPAAELFADLLPGGRPPDRRPANPPAGPAVSVPSTGAPRSVVRKKSSNLVAVLVVVFLAVLSVILLVGLIVVATMNS